MAVGGAEPGCGSAVSRSRRGCSSSLAVPHSLCPSLDLKPALISEQIMKFLSYPLWLRREARFSERGQSRAKQDRGVAILNHVTGLTAPLLLPYCSLGAATSLPPS